jgi:hypothetical protein
MFLHRVLERLCACADLRCCVMVESILRSDRHYKRRRHGVSIQKANIDTESYLHEVHEMKAYSLAVSIPLRPHLSSPKLLCGFRLNLELSVCTEQGNFRIWWCGMGSAGIGHGPTVLSPEGRREWAGFRNSNNILEVYFEGLTSTAPGAFFAALHWPWRSVRVHICCCRADDTHVLHSTVQSNITTYLVLFC